MTNELTRSQKIANLNDAFRKNLPLYILTGQVVTTAAIAELPINEKTSIFKRFKTIRILHRIMTRMGNMTLDHLSRMPKPSFGNLIITINHWNSVVKTRPIYPLPNGY